MTPQQSYIKRIIDTEVSGQLIARFGKEAVNQKANIFTKEGHKWATVQFNEQNVFQFSVKFGRNGKPLVRFRAVPTV
jgi:hypothetical protein